MSKVGKRIIKVPSDVYFVKQRNVVNIKGPLGEITKEFSKDVKIDFENQEIKVTPLNSTKQTKMLWGTTNSLLQGMVDGVTKGFTKELEIVGVGYNAKIQNNIIELSLGYSHKIFHTLPVEVKATQEKPTDIKLFSIDKQLVGLHASIIKKYRKPEPYGGKGIRYKGEFIKKKAGKAAAK